MINIIVMLFFFSHLFIRRYARFYIQEPQRYWQGCSSGVSAKQQDNKDRKLELGPKFDASLLAAQQNQETREF